jgi:hypothetical protein
MHIEHQNDFDLPSDASRRAAPVLCRHKLGQHVLLALVAGLFWVSASGAVWPAGELQVRGQATVTQTDGTRLPLSDTQYTVFSGDRIEVRNGQAVIGTEEGSSLGLSAGSSTTVVTEGGLEVMVHQGALVYSVNEASGVATLILEHATLCTEPDRAAGNGSVGAIEVNADSASVTVFEGGLVVCDNGPLAGQRIAAGERVVLTDSAITPLGGEIGALGLGEPSVTPAAGSAAATTTTPSTLANIGQWMANNPLLAGLAVTAGAAGAYYVVFDDDDSEPEAPVSP